MTAVLTPAPKAQFFTNNGEPLVGGKLYSYAAGTTTPLATYTTYAGNVANTNPVILDSRGEANVWLTSGVLYKLALYDADNALIWTVDNVSSRDDGIFTGPVAGTTATFSGALTAASGTFSGALTAASGTFSGALTAASGTFSGNVQMASANGGALAGLRNRVTNGNFYVDQRNAGASQTITAAAALAYTVDRFYAYCTGANVTGQRVAGTAPNAFLYRFTGAASVTKIGFAQRIENVNCQDLAGSTATLSVDLSNSLLNTVTWTASYASTANTFGTLASPTVTSIATGTFTVNSTLTRYSVNISIPSAATTGIQVELSVGAQTSGTWNIGNVQLEFGTTATPFEQRPIGVELALCQRYFETIRYQTSSVIAVCQATSTTAASGFGTNFAVTKISTPAVIYGTGSANALTATGGNAGGTILASAPNVNNFNWSVTSASGLVAGNAVIINCASTLILQASAEL